MIPRTVFGAADSGGRGRLHGVAGVALVADRTVEGEICPKLEAICRRTWISTAYNW